MPNQRVVVLTDGEIHALQGKAEKWAFTITAMAKLAAALKHPEGITDEMVGNLISELRGFDAGDEQDWIDARRALEVALFPGDGER